MSARKKTTPALVVQDFVESGNQVLRLPAGIIPQSYRVAASRHADILLLKEAEIGGGYYLCKSGGQAQ